jgi:tRNA(Arg) A34 adenosine deaminase TadA
MFTPVAITPPLVISQPSWLKAYQDKHLGQAFPSLEARMQLVIACQRENVKHGTGGPFAAAVFEKDSGILVSLAVNSVEKSHCGLAHAENMAIGLAEQKRGTYNLADPTLPAHQLVTSGQMCIMCYGGVIWSGVSEVVFGATAKDIETINGFDEGPLPSDWIAQLENRGIHVIAEYQREEAIVAHRQYRELEAHVYTPQRLKLG